jgi:hypothetical protein
MAEFADLTGLSSLKTPRRYLWTDSFAVCNFLELYNRTGDSKYLQLALRLVDQVHHILGRHREDDSRKGWISGLGEKEGEKHPTIGGLRIGKKMNERRPAEPFDQSLEWDRDGQYYHYLTKWMHALNRVSRVTEDSDYNTWAMELAKTAHAKFTYALSAGGLKRMYWKMSIDLSYPLVPSMGHHDPLDGFITYNQLQATATGYFKKPMQPDLSAEISDMADICKGKSWITEDPLGIGELLCNAYKAAQLLVDGHLEETDLPALLLDSSLPGVASYAGKNLLDLPADYRLAFRELGLSIGLSAVEELWKLTDRNRAFFEKKHPIYPRIEAVMQYMPLCEMIETFWLDHRKAEGGSWIEHRDINMVMLATSLAPGVYLSI